MVVDGTRRPRFRADIGIKDGVIAAIGRVSTDDADRVLDAEGLIVAPGFVDLHTHYDAQLFWDPYCSLSGWHGVTSVVIGNCGFGFAPVKPELRERAMLTLSRNEAISLDAMKIALPWDWESFPEFLDSVDRAPKSINILPYVPLAPLMIYVMGLDRAKSGAMPTDQEHRQMAELLDEAMAAGACGWSAQRGVGTQRDFDGTPMVTDVMHQETAVVLAEVIGRRNQGSIQATGPSDTAAWEELAAAGGRPMLFNNLIAMNSQPEKHRDQIRWFEECRRQGLPIYPCAITTDEGMTFKFADDFNIFDDARPWREAMLLPTFEQKRDRLADPAAREALRSELPQGIPIDAIVLLRANKPENKQYENLTMAEIGERLGKHFVDAMLDLAIDDDLETLFYGSSLAGDLDALREVVNYPWAIFGVSDGGAHTKFFCGGKYPTETLIRFVREYGWIDLEEAHWRLSALPAMAAGFHDRGMLREGAPADIVVYDFDQLDILPQEILHDLPGGDWRRVQRAKGYRWVLVNGGVTIEDDEETGVSTGALLRHGTAAQA
jgi:N-acyl-D-aspartate/D-glutamate deacylase